MKHKDKRLPSSTFLFIWYFLRRFKISVLVYVSLSLMAGLWGPFNSLLIKNIVDTLSGITIDEAFVLIVPVSLIALNFIVFDNLTWRGVTYIRCRVAPVIINSIISETMSYILSQSSQFFQDNLSGKISKQITNLADGVDKLISSVAANFLRGTSLLISAFITAYFVNPVFSAVLILWFIVFVSISMFMSKRFVALADKQALTESLVVGEMVDTVSNHSNVRMFARLAYENKHIKPFLKNQEQAYRKTNYYAILMHSIQGGLIAIMLAFSAYFLVKLYSKNLLTIGDFALIFGLAIETGHMTWFTMFELDEFNKAIGRCKQSLIAIMKPLDIIDKPNASLLKCIKGEISFNNVSFSYKDSDTLFYKQTVKINAGEKVGLVGYSGGGKSTFVNLIQRVYDVSNGAISIDGQNIKDVTKDSLHENIAMLPQDPSLFQRSVMENIRYGCINATDEEVILAAKKAYAHDFIVKLPQGYDSLVGERGIKLSGGQRQRIAIARAILKDALILILDEATSQLDSVTETLIQSSLWQLMQNKTTIVVAHRLSTLLHMDRILVFEQGKIIEDGDHKELLAKNGLYKTLWNAQVGDFLGDKRSV